MDFYVSRSRTSTVLIDNEHGAFEAAMHFIRNGRQRIAFIGGDLTHPSIRERLEGYRRALKERGIVSPPELEITDEDCAGSEEDDFHIEPHLTTMHVPKEELGALAVRRIVGMIEVDQPTITTNHVPVELIVRESCCAPRT